LRAEEFASVVGGMLIGLMLATATYRRALQSFANAVADQHHRDAERFTRIALYFGKFVERRRPDLQ
jgi:hypothetical protein